MEVTNKITVWKKLDSKTGMFEFNHIEFGYCPNDIPTPVSVKQEECWKGCVWKSNLGLLIKGVVVPWMKD